MRHRWLALLLALSLLSVATAGGQSGPSRKTATATRLSGTSLKIDGHLDEAVWASAPWFSDFVLKEPVEGGTPDDSTDVAFFYDDEALYVGARLWSRRLPEVPRPVTRRDQFSNAEYFLVALDPYLDRRTGYTFGVSSGGVKIDYYHPGDEEGWRDYAFDPIWETKIAFDSVSWTVEMRIPFSQLRFNDRPVQVWGMNINRWRPGFNDDIYWVVIPKNEVGFFSKFGTLNGIEGIKPTRRMELTPYVASNAIFSGTVDKGDPFTDGSEVDARAGADLKLGLGPNLTLDATVNPDFGQVEADPAEVNLTAYETFFPERRQFFIEGDQLLRGSGPGYYYSRRIGSTPHGSAEGDFVDAPNNTTILGAAKVTGRLGSGMSLGALAAVTQREHARTYDSLSGVTDEVTIEPASTFGVVRLQQEFGPSASVIGLTLTGMGRNFSGAENLRPQLSNEAFSGGLDWRLRFKGAQYEVGGSAGFSYIGGDAEAIAGVQQASAHYFQRPDQDHVEFDPTRTSMAGYVASLWGEKNGGKHWLYSGGASLESPGFELNDLGQLSSADDIDGWFNLRYRENTPGKLFHRYSVGMFAETEWNFGGYRRDTEFGVNTNFTFKNFSGAYLGAWLEPRTLSDDLTRGGPLMGTGDQWGINLSAWSSESKSTALNVDAGARSDEFGGYGYYARLGVTARPGSRWRLSINPYYERGLNPRQYLTTLGGGTPATFGSRYLFAFVDQTTLSAQIRAYFSFSPDLTLEAYVEPFAASGRYSRHGELVAAQSRDLRTYGTDNTTIVNDGAGNYIITDGNNGETLTISDDDFNVLSYRSNLVLRWEWRPGSTLFVIWQQNRSSYCTDAYASGQCHRPPESLGSAPGPGSVVDARTAPGDNFFAIKATYWLSLH